MSKIIYSGLESSGKSLMLAMKADYILERNARWLLKTGIKRPIVSNERFSTDFVNRSRKLGVPLVFWENLDELITFDNCDVFIDEVGTYFDSRFWTELSPDVRRWISQGAKRGIEMYGAAQDFAQVDVAFRRLTTELYYIKKLLGSPRPAVTKPEVKYVWGVCMVHRLDPRSYKETDAEFKGAGLIPSFFFIRKKFCEMFDTTQFLKKSELMPYRHAVRHCPVCDFEKVIHN